MVVDRVTLCLVGAVLAAGLIAPAQAGDFQVTRKIVQLWTTDDDDMRPEISGTVTLSTDAQVILQGGAVVPINAAEVKRGDLATFVCEEIGEGSPPSMKNCELLRTQAPDKPEKKGGSIKLW